MSTQKKTDKADKNLPSKSVKKNSSQKTKRSTSKNDDRTQEEITKGIETILTAFFQMLGKASKWTIIAILVLLILAGIVAYYLFYKVTDASAEIEIDQRIGITPTQVESIKAIGQWEFLSVADEELIDTTRNGFFTDDQLIRIYYDTLRLGIDMKDVEGEWIKRDKDSIQITLPPIRLLDEKFIDEARTKSFYESGSWTDADRESMYQRAYRRMKERCLTKQNITSAEENATRQFYQLMRSMGHENVVIKIRDER